jgi:kynurenine formamidase
VEMIDLSRALYHRAPMHPNHPPFMMTVWNDHTTPKVFNGNEYYSKAFAIAMSDHSGTHVDAPVHFYSRPEANGATIDEMPLERFYTEAICLDLSHVPLKHSVTVAELEAALAASGEEIRQGDTVLCYMATHDRLYGTPEYGFDFPGLSLEGIRWLADKGIGMFGVEAVSPAVVGETNSKAHRLCFDLGITHIECLCNLDKLVGRGRFRFIGFPLKIKGGSGSPIRAVALFED